jgi:hypothetical protein
MSLIYLFKMQVYLMFAPTAYCLLMIFAVAHMDRMGWGTRDPPKKVQSDAVLL